MNIPKCPKHTEILPYVLGHITKIRLNVSNENPVFLSPKDRSDMMVKDKCVKSVHFMYVRIQYLKHINLKRLQPCKEGWGTWHKHGLLKGFKIFGNNRSHKDRKSHLLHGTQPKYQMSHFVLLLCYLTALCPWSILSLI
jgi:hypothetical protein